MDEDTVICVDDNREIGHAIGVASRAAKERFRKTYVYTKDGFFWLTYGYPDVPRGDFVAECYPGGRSILRRLGVDLAREKR